MVTERRFVRIAPGVDVPYPEPSSAAASLIGRANRRTDTKPEVLLRKELHRRGLRFRKDHLVRAERAKARVDVCFTRARVAVFGDVCFWHRRAEHCHIPKTNQAYWIPKLDANVARDRRVDGALRSDGWEVVRVWEHEPANVAAEGIERIVRARRPTSR